MESSFYYFFSATPQVLAGVLALFGVFVIFKIQTIKNQLIGIGQAIIDEVQRLNKLSRPLTLSEKLDTNLIINAMKKAINRNDIKELMGAIDLIESQHFGTSWRKYHDVYDFLNSLINNTLALSTFTAIIIVICLLIIPFGRIILCNPTILYILFTFIIVCISICFIGLISVLKRSLKDSFYTLSPN